MFDIDNLIDKYLQQEVRERKIGEYYPSDLPYCFRKIFWLYKKPPLKIDLKTRKIFARGNINHSFIADVLRNSGFDFVKTELPLRIVDIESKIIIKARMDNLVKNSDGKKYVVEVKTVDKDLFMMQKPNKHHVLQLIPYLFYDSDLDGILVYVRPSTLEVKQFFVEKNWNMLEDLIKRARFIHKKLIDNELPFAEAKYNQQRNWECLYCPFAEECKKIESNQEQR